MLEHTSTNCIFKKIGFYYYVKNLYTEITKTIAKIKIKKFSKKFINDFSFEFLTNILYLCLIAKNRIYMIKNVNVYTFYSSAFFIYIIVFNIKKSTTNIKTLIKNSKKIKKNQLLTNRNILLKLIMSLLYFKYKFLLETFNYELFIKRESYIFKFVFTNYKFEFKKYICSFFLHII